MNYYRLAFWLVLVCGLLVKIFSLGFASGESFHLAHYFWLLIAAGAVVWVEKRKYKKSLVIGNSLK